MALPKNVADADEALVIDGAPAIWKHYPAIRAHLLSQDAEVERYKVAWTEYNDRTEWVQKTAKPKELGLHRADVLRLRIESAESRLAAANSLLRDVLDTYSTHPVLHKRIDAHLSENTHDRA